jgi:hypothetical protein
MPLVITIDGPTKRIVAEDAGNPVVTVGAKQLYSAWKDWVQAGNPQWAPAFRTIGGDPLGGSASAGDYYFLNNVDGWRVRPAERNHKLVINGNLYGEDPGIDLFAATLGGFQVLVQEIVSSNTQTVSVGSGLSGAQDAVLTAARDAAVLSRKLLQNKQITDPATGKLRVYDDNGGLLLEGSLFEDAAGSQAYRGQGAERRERLT